MTPSLFFRLVSWFAAVMAVLMGVLGVLILVRGQVLPAVMMFLVTAVNVFGWRLFSAWSARMRP